MHSSQDPIINNWYTNLTGKLFKVRMASYDENGIGSLVIEYIDGSRQIISRQEWECLKLMRHNSSRTRQKRASENQEELTH